MEQLDCTIFCENMKWLRAQRGLSYREMANLIHISVRSLKRIERGELPMTVDITTMVAIVENFGVSADKMLTQPLWE